MRGGFDYSKLGAVDKMLMSMMKFMIKQKVRKKKELSADERGMLAAFDKPADFTNEKNIVELVNIVKGVE